MDQSGISSDGSTGRFLKSKLMKTLEKRMEKQESQKVKAIKIDDKPKKRRGGKKYRNQRELVMQTELRKKKNRINLSGENVKIKYFFLISLGLVRGCNYRLGIRGLECQ